jgi:hypothetical protein
LAAAVSKSARTRAGGATALGKAFDDDDDEDEDEAAAAAAASRSFCACWAAISPVRSMPANETVIVIEREHIGRRNT